MPVRRPAASGYAPGAPRSVGTDRRLSVPGSPASVVAGGPSGRPRSWRPRPRLPYCQPPVDTPASGCRAPARPPSARSAPRSSASGTPPTSRHQSHASRGSAPVLVRPIEPSGSLLPSITVGECPSPTNGRPCSALQRWVKPSTTASADFCRPIPAPRGAGSTVAGRQTSQGKTRDLHTYARRIYVRRFRASTGL